MAVDPDPSEETAPGLVVSRFTVQRGMRAAVLIETPDWRTRGFSKPPSRVSESKVNTEESFHR
jgi:hypothetical protein